MRIEMKTPALLPALATVLTLAATAVTGHVLRPADPPAGAGPQALVDHWRARAGVPAVAVAVQRADGTRWVGTSGTLLRDGGGPVTPAARFRVASITKLFVATVVLQLAHEGRLAITDPLGKFVPGFPGADRITVGQLLDHTSGVPDHGNVDGFARRLLRDRDHRFTDDEVLSLIARKKHEFSPGTDYAYSNSGYVLLGKVIAAVTDEPWPAQVRRRILDPLNLTQTYVAGAEAGSAAVIPGFFDTDNDGTRENVETGRPWPALETSEGPAGAIVSTAGDLATFGDALYHGRLLDVASLSAMTAERPFHPRNSNYGYGTEITRLGYGITVLGHGGYLPGFKSVLWYVPSRDLTIAVLANDSTANPADVAELILRSEPS
jgi:D-alanyl-D-alanine carboxypeptidase